MNVADFAQRVSNRIQNVVHPIKGVPAEDAYATHIPVLVALGSLKPFRRVLEIGSGLYSSRLFLDRAIFSDLVELSSMENDPEWAKRVSAVCESDARFRMVRANADMSQSVRQFPLDGYDLIFIDDSLTAAARSETIREVVRQRPSGCLIVIHDFEHRVYREAARGMRYSFTFNAFLPHVGLLWDGDLVRKPELRKLRRLIAGTATPLNAADAGLWLKLVQTPSVAVPDAGGSLNKWKI